MIFPLLLTSCLSSPVLNHDEAEDTSRGRGHSQTAQQGCQFDFEKLGFCASMDWIKKATNEVVGSFSFRFWKKAAGSSSGPYETPKTGGIDLHIEVELWMPSMGHPSAPVTVTQQTDNDGNLLDGQFLATNVFFIMPEDWEIRIKVKDDAGHELDRAKIDLFI